MGGTAIAIAMIMIAGFIVGVIQQLKRTIEKHRRQGGARKGNPAPGAREFQRWNSGRAK